MGGIACRLTLHMSGAVRVLYFFLCFPGWQDGRIRHVVWYIFIGGVGRVWCTPWAAHGSYRDP